MPTYEYACSDCNNRFEVRQRMSDAPIDTCPQCGGRISRILFPVGIVFKGSGFYVTDNRSKSESSDGSTEKSSTESKPSGAAESKPTEGKPTSSSPKETSPAPSSSY